MSMLRSVCGLAVLGTAIISPNLRADEQNELSVLPEKIGGVPREQMLRRFLLREADHASQRRAEEYESLKSPEQLAAHQRQMREFFLRQLGGFPARTPLEARTVGQIRRDGYRVEKILFQSQPRHYVTGLLFLPQTKPPYPAVVVPCGHSASGKAANQRPCILLAKNGIAALCYDPIGQGERYQFLDDAGKERFRATTEHTLLGAGSIPLGRNTATYRVWDGMRAIDYLAGRKEIDAQRIGATGCSGGGTLTSYLMALDERVACAAPSCYLTSFQRLLHTIGPQDAEQNIHGQVAHGMDHADYVMMRAPRPTLILAATHDFFDIAGTWQNFRESKRFYTRLGFPERVALAETDTRHGYPRQQREAMVRWMRRWLLGVDDAVSEGEFETLAENDVQCSPAGQVMLIPGARSVVDLNVELEERLHAQRRKLWASDKKDALLDEVRRLAGVRPLNDLPEVKATAAGTIQRQGYRIDKIVLPVEPGIDLPGLLFVPRQITGPSHLYLHGEGKHVDAAAGGAIEKLALAGSIVLAVDPRGMGEIGTSSRNLWGGSSHDYFLAYLLGKSLVGMRAEDVSVAARFVAALHSDKPRPVHVTAIGAAGVPALHAAALEPRIFAHVTLDGTIASWRGVVRNPAAGGQLVGTVHGALRVYDLQDLVGTLPADKITIQQPVDVAKVPPASM